MRESVRLLLIDTCGETAGVAVCVGRDVVASEELPRSGASAEIVAAVRRLLRQLSWRLAELDAVGVVSGPGSFTGMRTGLAAAKGFCEAAGVRLIGISRLEVLADVAGVAEGLVALDAGRGELYVRDVVSGREWLCGDAEVLARVEEQQIPFGDDNQKIKSNCEDSGEGSEVLVVAEARVAERLGAYGPLVRPLWVGDALGVVLRRLAEGVQDAALVEANYVRGERDIYRKTGEPVKAGPGI